MQSYVFLLLGLSAPLVVAQTVTAPVQIDSDKLHLLKQTQPAYPPIAIAAHQEGEVKLQVTIAPDGHVAATKILSGPPMLQGAALDCVEEWIYAPTLDASGHVETVATVVSLPFDLKHTGHRADETSAMNYYALQRDCISSMTWKEKPQKQVKACLKAVVATEAFAPGDRIAERATANLNAAIALLHNQQLQQAIEYANKAVLYASPNLNNFDETANAYSVRAQAEAGTGKLPQAAEDLSKSEESLRQTFDHLSPQVMASYRTALKANLKAVLNAEAQLLTVEGKTAAASEKSAEAAKL